MLEVDLSLANLALDLIGQATLLLERGGDGDQLAFRRDVLDFRNCLLVEQPNGDFARTIARHLLYSTWQHMLLQRLTESSDQFLREFAAKAVKEIAYHRELAERMDGAPRRRHRGERPAHGRGARLVLALRPRAVRGRCELEAAIDRADRARSAPLRGRVSFRHRRVLAEAKLDVPAEQRPILGGRRGHHSEHLGHLLAVMQFLPRTYPTPIW